MTDLFQIPESKSPRLKWMEAHGITVNFVPADPIAHPAFWNAKATSESKITMAQGDTEDEALTNLAKRLGIRLWNEI